MASAGTIDYEEFIAATINLNRLEQEAAYQQAFQTFDTDNSGCLSVDEINNALKVAFFRRQKYLHSRCVEVQFGILLPSCSGQKP